jgi:ABC-type branched-subunit amino acid transport system ATPase component
MDVLETHALTRRFGDLMAVDTLSIRVQAGTTASWHPCSSRRTR